MKIRLYPKQITLLENTKQFGECKFMVALGVSLSVVNLLLFWQAWVESDQQDIEAIAFAIYVACSSAFLQAFIYWHLLEWLRTHSVPRDK